MEIICDTRERQVEPYLRQLCAAAMASFDVQQLTVSDYAIVLDGKIICVIERKTWTDLSSSMRDGRKNNYMKLLTVASQNPGCRVIYLIEGDPFPNPNRLCSNIPYANLMAHLDHLMIRDAIHIMYSKTPQHSAEVIMRLATNICSQRAKPITVRATDDTSGGAGECAADTDSSAVQQLKQPITTQPTIQCQLWQCLPYVGSTVSEMLVAANIYLIDVLRGTITEEQVAQLRYPMGKYINRTKVKQIIGRTAALFTSDVNVKTRILGCLPGMSRKTAQHILPHLDFSSIIRDEFDYVSFSNIKIGNRRISKGVIQSIFQHLMRSDCPAEVMQPNRPKAKRQSTSPADLITADDISMMVSLIE